MNEREISEIYSHLYNKYLNPIAQILESFLNESLPNTRIDRIVARAKTIPSFTKKATSEKNGRLRYAEPFQQIQDQIGVRIIVYYKSDIKIIESLLEDLLRHIERHDFIEEKSNDIVFGYEGVHYIFSLPKHILPESLCAEIVPDFFELQIKTLFQHAWAQAEHDLTYKPNSVWTNEEKKYINFIAAQAWAADELFDKLFLNHSEN